MPVHKFLVGTLCAVGLVGGVAFAHAAGEAESGAG
jgi:hypothetical protein